MKVLLIIPAYNESENIERVIRECSKYDYDYIIVNDGSTDCTSQVCTRNGFKFIDLPVNLGLTGAVQSGMEYAKRNDYDCAIQFDGDGQHDPSYIKAIVEQLENKNDDIVIGSRFCNKKKPKSLRMLGSNLIGMAIRLTTGREINDPTSGFRAYNRRMIEAFSRDYNLTPEPDTISYLIHCGAKVSEVPVEMRERIAGTSYLNLSRSIQYMLRMGVSVLLVQWVRKTEYFA